MTAWSSERIAQRWRDEVRARFEAENAEWRAAETAGIEEIMARVYLQSADVAKSVLLKMIKELR